MSRRAGVRVLGRLAGVVAAGALAALAWWALGRDAGAPGVDAALSLEETLGGSGTEGYALAERSRPFVFPDDHGAHPDFRNEWWYFTGNLRTESGRRFGYQLTFFRSALAPPDSSPAEPSSRWRTRQAWMAHFAVTDAGAGRFHAAERFERGALGLAGATVLPALRVWAGDWELVGAPGARTNEAAGVFPLTLRAASDSVAVELTLEPGRGLVLQGDSGLSRKGPGRGDASFYYSFPRLPTAGRVTTPAGTFEVTGSSWLDREWSTSVLPEGVVGWDWFALQLDDAREVMVYRLRRRDGSAAPWSEGLVVEDGAGGRPRVARLGVDDFTLEELARWESPVDGSAYPVRWRLRVPRHGLDLEVVPVLDGQELDLAFRYWEGAVDVTPFARPPGGEGREGRDGSGPSGRGYLELTGYAGAGPPGR